MIQWFTRYVLETLGIEACGFSLVDRTLDISQVRAGGDDTPTHQMFGERDHYFRSQDEKVRVILGEFEPRELYFDDSEMIELIHERTKLCKKKT